MGNVLDDVTDDNTDAHHVLRRVDDREAAARHPVTALRVNVTAVFSLAEA